jgi:peptide/nickel transport system permease protein
MMSPRSLEPMTAVSDEMPLPRPGAFWAVWSRRTRRQMGPAAWIAFGLFLCLLGFAVIGGALLPSPNAQDLSQAFQAPTTHHLFGTDLVGRDVAAEVAAGIRTSCVLGVTVAAVAAALGTTVGVGSGYFGGPIDAALMRLVDLQLAIPPIILLLAAATVVTPSVPTLIVMLVVVSWVPYARLTRARVLSERERAYIQASRLAGARHWRVMVQHLVPAVLPITVVFATLQVGFVVLAEAAISFLGLGLQPPTISLGYLVAQGRDTLTNGWWIAFFPGLALVLIVLCVNLFGDVLRSRMGVELAEAER